MNIFSLSVLDRMENFGGRKLNSEKLLRKIVEAVHEEEEIELEKVGGGVNEGSFNPICCGNDLGQVWKRKKLAWSHPERK